MDDGFELVEHGGDLGLEGWGATAGGAVGQLLLALWSAMYGAKAPPSPLRWEAWETPAELEAPMAVVEVLSEALYRASATGEAVVAFRGEGPERGRLGLAPVPDRAAPIREIKAVTYNEPRFELLPDGRWFGRVTVDL